MAAVVALQPVRLASSRMAELEAGLMAWQLAAPRQPEALPPEDSPGAS
jgi:hypothetical protein